MYKNIFLFFAGIYFLGSFFFVDNNNNNEIKFNTTGYNAFSGWTFYHNENIALGYPNSGIISSYQHKIHKVNNNNFFHGIEYFCDPDDVLYVDTGDIEYVAYLSYLEFERGTFLNNKRDLFALSYRHESNWHGVNQRVEKLGLINKRVNNPKIDIKIDKFIKGKSTFVDTRVYLKNRYQKDVNITFVTQDAAYMFLPDKNQFNVTPMVVKHNGIKIIGQYFYDNIQVGDSIGTRHEKEKFYSGYELVENGRCKVSAGIIPEYAFFKRHSIKKELELGYADVTRNFEFDQIYFSALAKKHSVVKKEYLKNRIMVFDCKNISPNEEIVVQYKQF